MTPGPISSEAVRDADVLAGLEDVCAGHGLDALEDRLGALRPWLDGDLSEVERVLAGVAQGETLAQRSARHLLERTGKLVRPLCVALSSRLGVGFTEAARQYAVAVELVHGATLLHDDVVDLGELRRGAPAARVVYGNAASIFGGDWLLCDALSRIQAAGLPLLLDRMLEVIKDMVIAESVQLAQRGRVHTDRDDYFRIVEGKTAALFRWAAYAGGCAGGVGRKGCAALEHYGRNLGVAFQIVDDVLDVTGDGEETGKTVLADLREGKMTYPLMLAAERDPLVERLLTRLADGNGVEPCSLVGLRRALVATGAVSESMALAHRLCEQAAASLAPFAPGPARTGLESVARAVARRRK